LAAIAFLHRCVEDAHRRLPNVAAGAVTLDEGDGRARRGFHGSVRLHFDDVSHGRASKPGGAAIRSEKSVAVFRGRAGLLHGCAVVARRAVVPVARGVVTAANPVWAKTVAPPALWTHDARAFEMAKMVIGQSRSSSGEHGGDKHERLHGT